MQKEEQPFIPPQVKQNKLQFLGVGNFAQHKVYVDEVPMADMLQEEFWCSLVQGKSGDRLFPGDALTIRQVKWKDQSRDLIDTVICRADCEVLATGKAGAVIAALKIWSFTEEEVAAEEMPEPKDEGLSRKWNVGKNVHEIYENGKLVHETKDKAEAESMVNGEIPIPKAA